MTAQITRTGEKVIQDNLQRQVESVLGGRKVLLWNSTHQGLGLRLDPRTGQTRSLVIMDSLATTDDRAYGSNRSNINVGIVGLVDAIEQVNAASLSDWLKDYPTVKLTPRDLAVICASHLADLFEKGHHGAHAAEWRLLLALGEQHAWEKMAARFGLKKDPRFINASVIPGAPAQARPLHYRPCWPSQDNVAAFLDLDPSWLSDKISDKKLAAKILAQSHKLITAQAASRSNTHFWIREYTIGSDRKEFPDFVLFINGLPIVWVEVKTAAAGIKSAIKDFQTKPSYQGAPMCLATNGRQCILASHMEGNLELWVHYDGNLGDRTTHPAGKDPLDSQQYLIEQMVACPSRFEFFLTRCGAIDEAGRYLAARSQQYQALAHMERDLQWVDVCNDMLSRANLPAISMGNRLIRQTQRTGKTHTLIRALHLALGSHPAQFRIGFMMVGEVLILGQIQDDLESNDLALADTNLVIHRVQSRQELNEMLERERSETGYSQGKIVLVNMQKISTEASNLKSMALPDSINSLVVVDEGHLGQTGGTADVRDMVFPNASHLLLTATPKDGMSKRYNITKDYHVLDDFGYGLAQSADIVCPVVYKRHAYHFRNDPELMARLAAALKLAMGKDVDRAHMAEAIDQILLDESDEANEGLSSQARALVRHVRKFLDRELIKDRLDAIVDELEVYRDSLEKKDGEPIFRPRVLAFDRDTDSAIEIIGFIQDENRRNYGAASVPAHELNVYRGARFALDVSDFGKDPADKPRTFQHYNPGIKSDADLKNRLKNTDPDMAVDVLLAVGKYTKGYNNDQLAIVALLRNVGEPSLMNQIYTRPATMREGKPKGVCLDLAFGRGNVACWQESLRLYDHSFDLAHLYTQDRVNDLVKKVGESLEKTANHIGMVSVDLVNPDEVLKRFEIMLPAEQDTRGRSFIVQARQTAELMSSMPDSSIYGALRMPLAGMRIALGKIKTLYPHLVKDAGVLPSGKMDGGTTPQSLGDMIRHALQMLDVSSLKALFDVKIMAATEICPDGSSTDPVMATIKERQAFRATTKAIKDILGHKTNAGGRLHIDDQEGARRRPARAETILLEALNRALDRLRDEESFADGGPSSEETRLALVQAQDALDAWVDHVGGPAGSLEWLVHDSIDQLVLQRISRLKLSIDPSDPSQMGFLDDLITLASREMSTDYKRFMSGLTEDLVNRNAEVMAKDWSSQFRAKRLNDFLGEMDDSRRREFASHHPIAQLRLLWGEDRQHMADLSTTPALIEGSMAMALAKQASVQSALDWKSSLHRSGDAR